MQGCHLIHFWIHFCCETLRRRLSTRPVVGRAGGGGTAAAAGFPNLLGGGSFLRGAAPFSATLIVWGRRVVGWSGGWVGARRALAF